MTIPPVLPENTQPIETARPPNVYPIRAVVILTISSTLLLATFNAIFGTGGFSNVDDPLAHAVERFIFTCTMIGPLFAGGWALACGLYTLTKR